MKKYIKPMMESEAFVANEFISTCYTVTCGSCGSWEEGYDKLAGSVDSKPIEILGQVVATGSFYSGTLENGVGSKNGAPCQDYSLNNKVNFRDIYEITWSGIDIDWSLTWQWLLQQFYGYNQGNVSVHTEVSVVPNWTHTTNHPNASV